MQPGISQAGAVYEVGRLVAKWESSGVLQICLENIKYFPLFLSLNDLDLFNITVDWQTSNFFIALVSIV